VLRGGSWNNNQDNARSADRNRNNPNNRNNNIGFRVVCSSTSFSSFHGKAHSGVLRACQVCIVKPGMPPALSADHGLRAEARRKDGAGASRPHG
jgi:Sulfatase-modifying factor enzyme 1